MTFDEWWEANLLTPEHFGSMEAWARMVWENAQANAADAARYRHLRALLAGGDELGMPAALRTVSGVDEWVDRDIEDAAK